MVNPKEGEKLRKCEKRQEGIQEREQKGWTKIESRKGRHRGKKEKKRNRNV